MRPSGQYVFHPTGPAVPIRRVRFMLLQPCVPNAASPLRMLLSCRYGGGVQTSAPETCFACISNPKP